MEIRTEVEIRAPLSEVWGILTDFQRYPEWNPFITEIAGNPEESARLLVQLSLPEGRDYRLRPRLTRVRENDELRFRAHFLFPGLFDGEHFFRLEQLGADSTRFVQGENFSGILLRFASAAITKVARGFVYMNQALKQRAEAEVRTRLRSPRPSLSPGDKKE